MHRKLQCLQVALINRNVPILLHDNAQPHITQPVLQKLNELGYEVSSSSTTFTCPLPTDYHFFKHLNNFFLGKCFHNQQEAENAFQEIIESWMIKSMDSLCYRNKQTYFLLANCIDFNGSYFD